MTSRRCLILAFAAIALGVFAGPTLASPSTVEIIATVHPPGQGALGNWTTADVRAAVSERMK